MKSIEHLRGASGRLQVLRALLLLGFALLAMRATQLTLYNERGSELGRAQSGRVQTFAAPRGGVFDQNGAELAVTVHAPSVYATPAEIRDTDATARVLAPLLGQDLARLQKRLRTSSRFVFLKRWAHPATAEAVRARALPGIGVVMEPRRSYPLGTLAGPVVGFANIDGAGVRGVEQAEDAWLRGGTARARLERDARGRLLARAGFDPRASAGGDIALHLDATLQAEMERALAEFVQKSGARGGLAIALEAQSGALLGAAEYPGMDPNAFRTLPYARTRSRIFHDAFEPGSVLKPLVMAAALELGWLHADELIDCEQGSYAVPGKVLHDIKPSGLLRPADLLRVSSNIGIAKIAQRLEPATHFAALGAFGLGRSTGSGFPGESAGLLRAPQHWQPLDQATIAFGQGVNVTAVQLAAALAVFANDGEWRAPQLVRARREVGGGWRTAPAPKARRVLRPATARALRGMLETVTAQDGTGRRAALTGVRIAGKTGTAQKFDRASGRYSNENYRAWFAGLAPVPASARRAASDIVVVTMVDEPRGIARGGGDVAAPLFARIASAALERKGVWTRPRFGLARNAQYPPPDAQPAGEKTEVAQAHDKDAAPSRGAAPSRVREVNARGSELPSADRMVTAQGAAPSRGGSELPSADRMVTAQGAAPSRGGSELPSADRMVTAQGAAPSRGGVDARSALDSIDWLHAPRAASAAAAETAARKNSAALGADTGHRVVVSRGAATATNSRGE